MRGKRQPGVGASLGYGMMMLVLFLTSTVLIGTSVQMLLGNSSSSYLGTYSQDSAAATEVAQSGMEAVLSDIQSKINAGTLVTTSYTYNSVNITMPTDPSSLGGGTTTIGSYSATVTAARGNTYLVQVTANVNTSTVSYSKLLTLSRNGNLVDVLTGGGANAAYSVRKLRSAYNGSAIRVRRSSDNTEQDIGFDGNGNLDVASLKTFLSASTLPVDSVGSAAVAFGMRKLRTAYTGYCLKVRRSSDSATQDIGFTSAGDLDVTALLNFVGTGTGYVTTWYDQSGNARNATQATTTYQPTIVTSGVLNTLNNRPIMTFDGVDDTLTFSNALYNDITIMAVYNAITGTNSPGSLAFSENNLISADVAYVANDYMIGIDTSGNVNAMVGNPDTNSGSYAASPGSPGDNKLHWMAFTRTQSTAVYSVYTDSGSYSDTNGNTASLNANSQINIGFSCGSNCGNGHDSLSEVLGYSSVLSESNRQLLERNEGWYYNLYPIYQSVGGPLDTATSALPCYGLRKLRSAYGGYAIRVRRSSDNTTQDIGFDTNGNLDVASLKTFVGAGSGYVTIWYDQSTNGTQRNATQATNANQPRIVNAGVLDTQNGRPSLYFAIGNSLATSAFSAYGSAYHVQAIAKVVTDYITGGASNALVSKVNSNLPNPFDFYTDKHYIGNGVNFQNSYITNTVLYDSTQPYSVWSYDGSTSSFHVWHNGVLNASGTPYGGYCADSSNALTIGVRVDGSNKLNGYIGEVLTYSSQITTANRLALERNQLQYFATPLPAAYVTKWYDQSGNGNDAVQTNPMFQPTLMISPSGSNTTVPTVMFNGGQYLASSTGHPTTSDYSKAAVFSYFNNSNGSNNIISSNGASGRGSFVINGTYANLVHNLYTFATNTWSLSFNQPYSLIVTYVESSKTGTIYALNTSVGSSASSYSATTTPISLGTANYANYLYGNISEAIVFPRVLSAADRTAIYTDEQNYFSSQ